MKYQKFNVLSKLNIRNIEVLHFLTFELQKSKICENRIAEGNY